MRYGEKQADIFVRSQAKLKKINCPSSLNSNLIDEFLIIFLAPESKIQKNKLILTSKYCTSTICEVSNIINEIIHDLSKIKLNFSLFDSIIILRKDKNEITAIGVKIKIAAGIP